MHCLLLVIIISFIGSCLSRSITGNCHYEMIGTNYMCRFSSQPYKRENDVIHLNGTHIIGHNDDDVDSITADPGSFVPVMPIIFCEKFKNVRAIILARVQLSLITDNSFSGCRNLEFLLLGQNRIRIINSNVFQNNVKLTNIQIVDNQITHIEDDSFRNLAKLQNLEFDRNRINGISSTTFRGLTSLSSLSLQGNAIVELPSNAFSDLENIAALQLFDNTITRVHPEFLESLPNRRMQLNLVNNNCISASFMFTMDTIDEIKPYFSECFDNYKGVNINTTTP